MFKKITITVCVLALILLAACKQNKVPSTDTTSNPNNVQSNTQSTTSGIELEEDVFDDDDITTTPSENNTSNGNLSSNQNTPDENTSSEQTTSGDNLSNDNSSVNDSSENNSNPEDSNQSNNDIVVDDDGTIKLPIDKFN